ncbi:hypothetical protein TIFTF001_016882 [Ficus carica]|uniref:Uncharacterized protein n=1 Tax=Ficus carica TaxID=3494 RepID=A0AA88DIX7_FICCA|nr:hypothetical protein TIFTF001_016882 [Ficus carica]
MGIPDLSNAAATSLMSPEKEIRHCVKLLQSRSTTMRDRDALTVDPLSITIVSHRRSPELTDEDSPLRSRSALPSSWESSLAEIGELLAEITKLRSEVASRPGNSCSRAVFGLARLRHDTISINTNTTRLINGPRT